jgi:hypothetical protein
MKNNINSIHNSLHYCSGYQDFLKNKQEGINYTWNWQYFFFFMQWLIIHKMYGQVFVLIFFYLNLTSLLLVVLPFNDASMPIIATVFLACHIFFTFISYNLYHIHLENKFHKINYEPIKCENIAKPYPFYVIMVLCILVPCLTIACFNILYRFQSYLKF